MLEILLGLLE